MTTLPPGGMSEGRPGDEEPEVGAFHRGNSLSRVALARYLVARALMHAIARSMYSVAIVVALIGIACFVFWLKWLGVLIFILALIVLGFRALFMALLRRLAGPLGSAERKVRRLVDDSRSDLQAELHRIGLPSSMFGLPLLAIRFIGKRRAETLARLKEFEVERVVPPARLDELHLIIENDVLTQRHEPWSAP